MTTPTRGVLSGHLGWLVPGVVSALLAGFAAILTFQSATRFSTASDQLAKCEQFAQEWRALSKRPTVAVTAGAAAEDITTWVETARIAAGLETAQIRSILPEPPRPLPKQPFRRHEVRLQLENVTLPQLLKLCLALEGEQRVWATTGLELRPGTASPDRELWSARLILTKLVFAPITPRGS